MFDEMADRDVWQNLTGRRPSRGSAQASRILAPTGENEGIGEAAQAAADQRFRGVELVNQVIPLSEGLDDSIVDGGSSEPARSSRAASPVKAGEPKVDPVVGSAFGREESNGLGPVSASGPLADKLGN